MLTILTSLLLMFSVQADEINGCGKLNSAVLEFNFEKKEASMDALSSSEVDFCDQGLNELNANFQILLLNKNKKIVNKKSIFINMITVLEGSTSKSEMVFGHTKFSDKPQYRNIKFSIIKNANPTSYKIISIADQKVYGEGVIK